MELAMGFARKAMALGLGAVVIGGAAHAFVIMTTETGAKKRWFERGTLPFHIATVAPEEVDAAGLESLLQTAFDTWTDTACGTVPEVAFAGTLDVTRPTAPLASDTEPDNVVVFVPTRREWQELGLSSTWIAITLVGADGDSGEIVDADLLVNDGGFVFSDDEAAPAAGVIDFRSVLTHEIGHFFGMDHSADLDATMYPDYAKSPDGPAGARTLAQDDVDGVCSAYTDVPEHVVPKHGGDGGGCAGGGVGWLALGLGASVAFGARARGRARARAR